MFFFPLLLLSPFGRLAVALKTFAFKCNYECYINIICRLFMDTFSIEKCRKWDWKSKHTVAQSKQKIQNNVQSMLWAKRLKKNPYQIDFKRKGAHARNSVRLKVGSIFEYLPAQGFSHFFFVTVRWNFHFDLAHTLDTHKKTALDKNKRNGGSRRLLQKKDVKTFREKLKRHAFEENSNAKEE